MDLLPVARSSAEAHLYLQLHACVCGETAFTPDSSVIEVGDQLASRYAGSCPACDRPREFVFALPEDIVMSSPTAVEFGGAQPSALIDPGQWMWLADRFASGSPQDPQTTSQLRTAVACVSEVVKFVPDGAEAVPVESFTSELGRSVYDAEPGRFDHERLQILISTYADLLATA